MEERSERGRNSGGGRDHMTNKDGEDWRENERKGLSEEGWVG